MENYWKKCSICKSEIPFSHKYYVCSVSSCNGKRTGLVFCSTTCFERHLPGARHKDAAAVEERSPDRSAQPNVERAPVRRIIASTPKSSSGSTSSGPKKLPNDTLVVVSKLKEYIKAAGDMNTSASCNSALSDIIRRACDQAIESARRDGRKTVMDRDFN